MAAHSADHASPGAGGSGSGVRPDQGDQAARHVDVAHVHGGATELAHRGRGAAFHGQGAGAVPATLRHAGAGARDRTQAVRAATAAPDGTDAGHPLGRGRALGPSVRGKGRGDGADQDRQAAAHPSTARADGHTSRAGTALPRAWTARSTTSPRRPRSEKRSHRGSCGGRSKISAGRLRSTTSWCGPSLATQPRPCRSTTAA